MFLGENYTHPASINIIPHFYVFGRSKNIKIVIDDEQLKPLPMDWKNKTKKKGTHGFFR